MEAYVHQSDLLLIELLLKLFIDLLLKLLIELGPSLERFNKVKVPTVNRK